MEKGKVENDKKFISATDEVTSTTSTDAIAAPGADSKEALPPADNVSLTEHTKDLAAKALVYLQNYGMLAGAVALTTAATIIVIRKLIKRTRK
jgi:hypothetical protein